MLGASPNCHHQGVDRAVQRPIVHRVPIDRFIKAGLVPESLAEWLRLKSFGFSRCRALSSVGIVSTRSSSNQSDTTVDSWKR